MAFALHAEERSQEAGGVLCLFLVKGTCSYFFALLLGTWRKHVAKSEAPLCRPPRSLYNCSYSFPPPAFPPRLCQRRSIRVPACPRGFSPVGIQFGCVVTSAFWIQNKFCVCLFGGFLDYPPFSHFNNILLWLSSS